MKEHQKHGFEKQFLTDDQYVAVDGLKCPNCHKDTIEGDSWNSEAGHAWQDCSCLTCGATWNDTYKLIGYDDLDLDNGES